MNKLNPRKEITKVSSKRVACDVLRVTILESDSPQLVAFAGTALVKEIDVPIPDSGLDNKHEEIIKYIAKALKDPELQEVHGLMGRPVIPIGYYLARSINYFITRDGEEYKISHIDGYLETEAQLGAHVIFCPNTRMATHEENRELWEHSKLPDGVTDPNAEGGINVMTKEWGLLMTESPVRCVPLSQKEYEELFQDILY